MYNKFIKHDQDKPNMAMLLDCPLALQEVAKVIEYGAKKYNRKNWILADKLERYESASLRHQMAFHNEQYLDEESGLHHLAHSITNNLFLLELELRKKETKEQTK